MNDLRSALEAQKGKNKKDYNKGKTTIKIYEEYKPLFDEIAAEERTPIGDFFDKMVVYYAEKKAPQILEKHRQDKD